jgi:hypothetical protein
LCSSFSFLGESQYLSAVYLDSVLSKSFEIPQVASDQQRRDAEVEGIVSLFNSTPSQLSFYTPLYHDAANHSVTWEWPLIYIVHSRFMQFQGSLTELGQARLRLFETFCLPTMRQQSSQRFLWLIKTDPELDSSLLNALVELVKPYPNFYVVKSTNNLSGKWRSGQDPQDLARSKVYSGDRALLERAMTLKDQRIVLETRLDADDGLHVQFAQHMEEAALKLLAPSTETNTAPLKWAFWCIRQHFEWHWEQTGSHGTLNRLQRDGFCVTPGLTVGLAVGTANDDIPDVPHSQVASNLARRRQKQHLQFMVGSMVYSAIRSRSPTSASMGGVIRKSRPPAEKQQQLFWNALHDMFGLNREAIGSLHEYMTSHLVDIAKDSLQGQCTLGHSCKKSAQADLQKLINRHSNNSKVN